MSLSDITVTGLPPLHLQYSDLLILHIRFCHRSPSTVRQKDIQPPISGNMTCLNPTKSELLLIAKKQRHEKLNFPGIYPGIYPDSFTQSEAVTDP